MRDITFSLNSYDSDGDIVEEGVFIHFDNVRIHVCRKDEIERFGGTINLIVEAISESH